jgi:hypothetical protein
MSMSTKRTHAFRFALFAASAVGALGLAQNVLAQAAAPVAPGACGH